MKSSITSKKGFHLESISSFYYTTNCKQCRTRKTNVNKVKTRNPPRHETAQQMTAKIPIKETLHDTET